MNSYLEDEEPVVIEVDTTPFQERLYFLVVALLPIDGIFAIVALIRSSSDDEVGVRHNFEGIGSGLYGPQSTSGRKSM